MVRYEWQSYPHGVANNLYTSLDAYVDFDSDTWSGMKDMIENFNYGGKHYYLPYRVNPGVVLIYTMKVSRQTRWSFIRKASGHGRHGRI